jgi:hypothetical protein
MKQILHRGLALLAGFLLVLLCGCEPSATREFNEKVARTKAQCRASDVRTAVVPLFSTNTSDELRGSAVPQEVRALPIFASPEEKDAIMGFWTWDGADPRGAAHFLTGSGFGHWGIAVSRLPDSPAATNGIHGAAVPWGEGVFFVRDWE